MHSVHATDRCLDCHFVKSLAGVGGGAIIRLKSLEVESRCLICMTMARLAHDGARGYRVALN